MNFDEDEIEYTNVNVIFSLRLYVGCCEVDGNIMRLGLQNWIPVLLLVIYLI